MQFCNVKQQRYEHNKDPKHDQPDAIHEPPVSGTDDVACRNGIQG